MRKLISFLLALAILPTFVSGAVIKGSVYDSSLEKTKGIVVEIDTSPKQQIVSNTGDYSFSVPQGTYFLIARELRNGRLIANSSEKIIVNQEGEFNIDLILFPVFEDIGIGDITFAPDLEESAPFDNSGFIILAFAAFGIILVAVFLKMRQINNMKPKVVKKIVKEIREVKTEKLPEDLEKLVGLLKNKGGRETQKEIRNQLNLSEAKVSLMVADLENRGIVKRIKKGRGNILVLS